MKQAKEEAQAEIEKYKKEREVEYKQHERQVLVKYTIYTTYI